MASHRRCTECGKSLAGKGPRALTCSDTCRSKRSRRMARLEKGEQELRDKPGGESINDLVKTEYRTEIEKIMKEELRPLVREAIDEDVLRAIRGMVGLAPAAVLAIADDLTSDDKVLRQRAYSLWMKYSLGNERVTPPREDSQTPFQVNFVLPRGDKPISDQSEYEPAGILPADAHEVRTCDNCGLEKPEGEFVGASNMCQVCLDRRRARVMAIVNADASGEPETESVPVRDEGSRMGEAASLRQSGEAAHAREEVRREESEPRPLDEP